MVRVRRSLPALTIVILAAATGCAAEPVEHLGSDGFPAPADAAPEATGEPTQPVDATGQPCAEPPCYGEIEHLGVLADDVVEQVSGMAASHRTPGLFYAVSDVPGTGSVAVIEEDGTLVAHIDVEGMSARDAESLAVGPCSEGSPDSCLYIGDIGNHVGLQDLFVYRLVEPDLTDPPASLPAERLRYTYPGEPTDAEALIVDAAGHPLIISKARFNSENGETAPTRLYRGDREGGQLAELGQISLPAPESGLFAAMVGHVVTGADAMDARVILRTYDEVYEYLAPEPDADVGTFPDWPMRRVPAPFQVQSETVAYRVDGCGYITTSELTGSVDAVTCQ